MRILTGRGKELAALGVARELLLQAGEPFSFDTQPVAGYHSLSSWQLFWSLHRLGYRGRVLLQRYRELAGRRHAYQEEHRG